ncbi:hypothetical protein CPB83DRAFT_677055 [Crepidotus variabilis]|uniref:RING-type domain-containing protein n=1 Tax=Crepidotus variabilis TaxID=179855 RepID=A0A9P6JUC7_9AGAR|nr:hypothetical protein CPB83DRAFT_677055 [Crepidotus variabilis]
MGQNSSRARRPSQASPPTDQEQSSTAFPSSSSSTSPVETPISRVRHTSDISGSRRSSVRKSILNLVKPSTIRSRVTSVASSPGDLTRSWRNSRRWSKVPVNNPSPFEEAEESSSSTSGVFPLAGPSTLDKGKQPERQVPLEEEDEEEYSYHEAPEEPQPQLTCNQSFTDIDEDSEPPCADSEHVLSSDTPPDRDLGPVPTSSVESQPSLHSQPRTTVLPSPAPTTPRPHTVPLPPRQFPPPGTLVIVQGVVHTTDISRTASQHEAPSQSTSNNLDVPDEPGRSRTRNRLSALLRPRSSSRRSSMAFNEAATTIDPSETESASPDTDGSRSLSEDTVLTTPSIDERLDSSQEPLSTPAPHPQEPASTASDNHPPSISSSSIDVLGTLLSVAAAATAASLLTGSSEPILSSGLAPTPSSTSTSATPTTTVSAPNQRAPPDVSAASRAERMRQAWGTIRERLGLRPSGHDTPPPPEEANGQVIRTTEDRSTSTTTDARELMLAEMARAFNIGLGLNGMNGEPRSAPGAQADSEAVGSSNSGESNQTSSSTSESAVPLSAADPPQPPLPPEGSFERFLVDLQIDLRSALTHVEEVNTEQTAVGAQSQSTEAQASHSETISESTQLEELSSLPTQPHDSALTTAVDSTIATEPLYSPPETDAVDELDDTLHDSDSDQNDDIDDDFDDEDFHSAEHEPSGTDAGQQSNDRSGPSSGMGRIDAAGRINWWRLYRFPAILSSSADQLPRTRQTNSTTQSSPTDHSSMTPSIPETASPTTILPTETPQNPAPAPETSTTPPVVSPSSPSSTHPLPIRSVVPVIIVGLQSVNSQWRPDMPIRPENEGVDIHGHAGDGPAADSTRFDPTDDGDLDGWGVPDDTGLGATEGGTRGQGRSRGWHSRAADALRNLRPGRRNAEPGAAGMQGTPGANGSRTFLIYVIGGYYPPDHNIVTGGPANFDSFEALLELADLLGQVKPPTVSKDDIENSGLEVVKASQLTKIFDEGKVTANCLDRCLICLEDYESEDDLRLLKCRHAFHQPCVDHWMQTGRNNCPACRSTGVSTEPRTAPSESVST